MNEGTRLYIAMGLGFLISLLVGWWIIPQLRRLKYGQMVREEGPQTHRAKQGTPTMGGIIFALPAAVVTLLLAPRDAGALVAIGSALGHGAVGFADDYIKVVLRRSLGLRAREKLFFQTFLALALAWLATAVLGLGTWVRVPYAGWTVDLGIFYYPFLLLLVFATGNSVNLTDGVDGLLAGASVIVFAFYALVSLVQGQYGLAVACVATVAACGGFLRYNTHPARVFMGDVGSLFLGGLLAAVAVLTKTELFLPLAGLLFVLEGLSVILQVISFRTTGQRIFRMSPLHHHFELSGWSETTVVRVFWLVAATGCILAWWGLR